MAGVLAGLTPVFEPLLPRSGASVAVPEAGRAPLVAALAANASGPLLLLAATPARAQAALDEAATFLGDRPVLRLPERERLPYEFTRDDPVTAIERSRALAAMAGEAPALIVTSWAALTDHCAGPDTGAAAIDVRVGGRLDPGELLRRLEDDGYGVELLAERPGTVAHRGGIVDVFPADGETPYRVEFFGDEVESIRVLDLATQRSVRRVQSLAVAPVATGTLAARDAARALATRLEAWTSEGEVVIEQLELLSEGNRSDYGAFFEPFLATETALAYANPGLRLVLEDGEEGEGALARVIEQEGRARDEQERRGAIPSGLPGLRPTLDEAKALVARLPLAMHLQRFGNEDLGVERPPLHNVPSFAGRLKPFAEQCLRWAREGRRVVVASQQALRLAEILEADGGRPATTRRLDALPAPGSVTLLPLAIGGGIEVEDGVLLVSDAEIFGFRKRRRPSRSRAGVLADLVSTLEVGDYLVHADHGISRYGGLLRKSVDGIEREYLELQYADGDRLYVPTDGLDSVTRYVGPSDHPPALTRLGSQDWARAKRRVRQAVIEMAHELLQLYARRELAPGHAFSPDGAWQMEMEAAFPYVETSEQLAAIADVKTDMERTRPMDRLICGDVGYGKTEVAVRAAFKAAMDGPQVAVLVPTTVLAEQHGATFRERLAGFPVRVEVLSRFRSEAEQREIVAAIASGEVDIAIGTHRLLQRDVHFKDLGLVVIDEEQRFGVANKERLKQMRSEVDMLTLSATPIPRTLQMSLAGIRDMSTIMTPPEERLPIRTYVLQWDDEIIREAIDRELQRGGQVYFVHNRVHNIERIVTRLRAIAPDARIAIGHGQMPEEQLERVMTEFGAGDHDILVCTTIIESGLDIPNVNTIIINNADQFGLAQLYQLRGRVGRGSNRAYAYLLYERDRVLSEPAMKRLQAVFEATELGAGFQIALRDLEIRGAGNVLGAEQSGHIAAVGFEMYTKLMGEAVAALKSTLPSGEIVPPSLPPSPTVDLPLSAFIPDTFIPDIHDRLAAYQRIALIETVEGIAAMQEELRDRFGPVPPAVENLLYVALVKSVARRARVESIRSDEQMFHLRIRGGVPAEMRTAVEALRLTSVLVGPQQVRIDRISTASAWQPLLVRILRAMAGAVA